MNHVRWQLPLRLSCLVLSTPSLLRPISASAFPLHSLREPLSRSSHFDFFLDRDWKAVESFWRQAVRTGKLPSELCLNSKYAPTDCGLKGIEEVGMLGEFLSKDSRYLRRRTYALRIGYVGTEFKVIEHYS